ncbi:MAG: DNA-binding response regulator, partial [Verrucomicrobiales bacterium]|nr:DNA-binding response regulator [Verrucomicrobiales bacterium]
NKPSPKKPLKIVLVEDQPEIRASWMRLIGTFPDFSCVGTCTSAEEALRTIPTLNPDVVLMDVFLPRMSGIECTARLKVLLPQVHIVMLTAADDDEMVFLALEAGADGYLLKQTKPADLRDALLEVLSGGAPMTSEIARRVVHYFRDRAKVRDTIVHLAPREKEILSLLSKGYANKEIADGLSLSVETVRSYLKSIYEKMQVHSRSEAVARYMSSEKT